MANSGKVLAGDINSRAAKMVDKSIERVTGEKPLSDEERYRVDDAMRTIMRASEHASDPKLMGHVSRRTTRLGQIVKKLT